jgi:hypothetical protein
MRVHSAHKRKTANLQHELGYHFSWHNKVIRDVGTIITMGAVGTSAAFGACSAYTLHRMHPDGRSYHSLCSPKFDVLTK